MLPPWRCRRPTQSPTAVKLVSLGVTAIWNFAHVDLDNIEGVVVENVHLSDSLMQLSTTWQHQNHKKIENR